MKNINALCTRKQFLIGSSVAAVGLFCGRGLLQAQPGSSPSGPGPSATPESADNVPDFPEHHPQFDRARVKRFVIAGHVNLTAVKAMLVEEPNLINGAIDWGNGDFETALGGASPNIVHVPGPHGIPLIVHARKGGPAAKAVLEFLQPLAGPPQPGR